MIEIVAEPIELTARLAQWWREICCIGVYRAMHRGPFTVVDAGFRCACGGTVKSVR